jgi:hypothetical protein
MTRATRRRLPARVYWVRRLMVLGIATLLVVGIAKMLGGSSDGSSGPDRATPAAQTSPRSSGATLPGSGSTAGSAAGMGHHVQDSASAPPLVMPSGPCAADDVAVSPSVPRPVAGSDISLLLEFSTIASPACDWTMSGRSLALRITSGPHLIWTTVQCAKAIPTRDLVLRNTQVTPVKLTWNAKRSEPGCPRMTAWAVAGTYHLRAAALGGEPQETTFELTTPAAPVVTRTAHPHTGKKHQQGG